MMSKILNTKSLILILVIVAALYFVSTLFEKKDRTFKSELVSVDTSEITGISIIPKTGVKDEVLMSKSGGNWSLEKGGVSYNADRMAAKNILSELVKLKPERVAANDPGKWDELQVTDSTGTKVKLYKGKRVVAEVYIGKFDYQQNPQGQQMAYQQQNRGKMSTHVRLADENEVYVVDGFLKMNIQADVNTYRDKNLCSISPSDLTRVTFNYPENKFVLEFIDSSWTINGMPADSLQTARYLQGLQRLTSTNFIDDADPTGNIASHTVKLEGNNFLPVELKAYPADSVNRYLVTSSLNPGAKFSGEKSKLFEKVFKSMSSFVNTAGSSDDKR